LGFYFAEAPHWSNGSPPFRIEFFERDELRRQTRLRDEPLADGTPAFRTAHARLKLPNGRARSGRSTLPLILEIDANVARIGVDSATWASVGETVLYAVAQHWRLIAIDRALDELSAWARADVQTKSGLVSAIRPRRAKELRARRSALQQMILDLPDFEGSLTNPRGHFASGRSVQLYRKLCAWLGLAPRRRELDERVEVVESIYDSLAESLNHSQSLAFQIVLELAIVALLLLDVGFYLYGAIS